MCDAEKKFLLQTDHDLTGAKIVQGNTRNKETYEIIRTPPWRYSKLPAQSSVLLIDPL